MIIGLHAALFAVFVTYKVAFMTQNVTHQKQNTSMSTECANGHLPVALFHCVYPRLAGLQVYACRPQSKGKV